MEYKVHYNGQETNDFDTLASWFMEVYDKMRSLEEECDELKSVKQLNIELMEENRKTNEVLKKYCGSLVAPIPTIVGMVIDDFFYQKAETENQVRELQKAEKTIEKLNTELVVYADKVDELGKWIAELEEELKQDDKIIDDLNKDTVGYANKVADQREQIKELEEKLKNWEKKLWDPEWCRLIDKLNEMIDKEAPIPRQLMKVYTNVEDEIWDKLNYLTRALCMRNVLNDVKNKRIRELENKVNELDVEYRRLKLENEKLIHFQGDNAIEHAAEITDLKQEISALKKELEERKNERSPRWWSDVMRIEVLKTKADKLTKENRRLREEVESLKGQNEVLKIKNAYPICPIFEANSKEAANRIAERIRKGLD